MVVAKEGRPYCTIVRVSAAPEEKVRVSISTTPVGEVVL